MGFQRNGGRVMEKPLVILSDGVPLVGMFHGADGEPDLGVLVMVAGGPQYRIGGHRQLVQWGRQFAEAGFPVLRFDFKGMGDSYGDYAGFEDTGSDIRSAINCLFEQVPSLKRVVLWGECNACSASLFYAHQDSRVAGIAMLNPWVRTEAGEARTIVKHYYLNRLMSPSFWRKVLSLQFDIFGSLRSAIGLVRKARGDSQDAGGNSGGSLPDRMLAGLKRFNGRLMMVMSGRDLVPKEFDELVSASTAWQEQLAKHHVLRHDLPLADHTFSCAEWRDQVGHWGLNWLHDLASPASAGQQR